MAYSFQTFVQSQILTAAQMNQVEENARAHVHGVSSVSLIVSGSLANGAVHSANVASGQIGFSHLAPEANLVKAWADISGNGSGVFSLNGARGISAIVAGSNRIGFTLTQTMTDVNYAVTTGALKSAVEPPSSANNAITLMENVGSRSRISFAIFGSDGGTVSILDSQGFSVIAAGNI